MNLDEKSGRRLKQCVLVTNGIAPNYSTELQGILVHVDRPPQIVGDYRLCIEVGRQGQSYWTRALVGVDVGTCAVMRRTDGHRGVTGHDTEGLAQAEEAHFLVSGAN